MRLGFTLLREPEVVAGLRANVSKLQVSINRHKAYIAKIEARNEKLRRQLAIDRDYIDRLKAGESAR
jgi:hypothetical protein